MYVSMTNMLAKANKENYAVAAINCFNLESAYAVITAAEEMNSPIIIDLLMEHLQKHLGMETVLPCVIDLARKAKVHVAINLDHGKSKDYVVKAIHAGFSSVMMDSSELTFEQNIKNCQEICEIAQKNDVSVEAEVGAMGAVKNSQYTNQKMYTDPAQAIEFVRLVPVTALAISFGSSHGIMPKDYVPKFNFDILKEIKKATNMPLVLHGSSGCGPENISKSVEFGINKVNIGSDVMKAQSDSLCEQYKNNPDRDFVEIVETTIQPAIDTVKKYIKIVGSSNKE
ncbi:class II fructose-bisphosphate aldolase family protein [Lactobacillus sp. ESL0791]|uniref:class II fructose-bisphosphate aldolase n=1 Tax=Lactobacillus sp. ESL0791 TaxID=2983234 RepID=UPI0023F9AB49|nr:class II fructose-bisphosphate aldolase [Lactobacillus sp. ESL0791]MDF7638339.1 class II fructose-bisphosphate aldolase family protein [Lactobacillus sp. ESL0791]